MIQKPLTKSIMRLYNNFNIFAQISMWYFMQNLIKYFSIARVKHKPALAHRLQFSGDPDQ